MSRLIDADALQFVEACIEPTFVWDKPHWETIILKDRIDNAPTIDAVPKWIPCSERLPEEYGDYLVTMESTGWNLETYRTIDIAYFDTGWHKADMVLAWMPMPKAYEGERQ